MGVKKGLHKEVALQTTTHLDGVFGVLFELSEGGLLGGVVWDELVLVLDPFGPVIDLVAFDDPVAVHLGHVAPSHKDGGRRGRLCRHSGRAGPGSRLASADHFHWTGAGRAQVVVGLFSRKRRRPID